MEVRGAGVSRLDAEAGGHRVQRVPRGEKRGRVHSSTVTVAVLREGAADPALTRRAPADFEVEWYSGSGSGGQHRNKHQNSARVRHLPTGLVRTAQTRKRETSLREAMEALGAELDRMAARGAGAAENGMRAGQIGSGMRSDKRRTYRFQDGTVKDHVTGRSAQVDAVMAGGFERLW